MTKLQQIQTILGVTPDDDWGLQSQGALEIEKKAAKARRALRQTGQTPNPVNKTEQAAEQGGEPGDPPWPLEADAAEFYGRSDGSQEWEAANLTVFEAPYTFYMDGTPVRKIRCHKKVAKSLRRIMQKILALYPMPQDRASVGVDQYDGCYNYRSVRGASHLSMHAYGAAIDLDAAHNPLGATKGRMPMAVVEIFKAEGWRWGGDYTNRKDLMHFEACR